MGKYKFKFSVVMPVYGVEAFLSEAVGSVIHQSIGFSNIQLIMVDDGSRDRSGEICDSYADKYPKNIKVVHKNNGGPSSARNTGIKYIEGKYVGFLDPDDTWDKNVLEKVWAFMEAHNHEVRVCCIPMFFFGNNTGAHPLNNKFKEGTRVINLLDDKNQSFFLLSAATSFYKASTAKSMHFDTELYQAEDAKETLRLLIDDPFLGAVADTKYNYRKHGNSVLDKGRNNPRYYITHLKRFSSWILDFAEEKYGVIPRFVQQAIMYELQWKLDQKTIPGGVLTTQETDQYRDLLFDTIGRIDDDVILQQDFLSIENKLFVLSKKYGNPAKAIIYETGVNNNTKDGSAIKSGEVVFRLNNRKMVTLSDMTTYLELLQLDSRKGVCRISGRHVVYPMEGIGWKPCLVVGNKVIKCVEENRRRMDPVFLGETVAESHGFRASFPIEGNQMEVSAAIMVNGTIVYMKSIHFGKFFPVTDSYQNAYADFGKVSVTISGGRLRISPRPNWLSRTVRECRYLQEIWKKNLLGGRKSIGGRLFYHAVIPFKRKKIWIISDRIIKADDNGEALYKYLLRHKPKDTYIIFAISKDCDDYSRIKKIGKCVNAMSIEHKLLYLLCDVNISSHADGTRNPYLGYQEALRDILHHQTFVFLQHGITQGDMSGWLNKYNLDIRGFITAAEDEQKSIISGDYHYSKREVWLTGFPRYDLLYNDEENIITIMPTWRIYLMDYCDPKTEIWRLRRDFENQDFYRFYDKLLNSPKLLDGLDHYGYTLQFFPHPTLQPYINRFHHDKRVRFLSVDSTYREVFAKSRLVVTDYSSAVFDFAYLRKPVVYCQFDQQEVFSGSHIYEKGYFDYQQNGFGEVVTDVNSTIDLILQYASNGCQLKEVYKKRIDSFFAFNDRNNCKRVLEKIMKMQ